MQRKLSGKQVTEECNMVNYMCRKEKHETVICEYSAEKRESLIIAGKTGIIKQIKFLNKDSISDIINFSICFCNETNNDITFYRFLNNYIISRCTRWKEILIATSIGNNLKCSVTKKLILSESPSLWKRLLFPVTLLTKYCYNQYISKFNKTGNLNNRYFVDDNKHYLF